MRKIYHFQETKVSEIWDQLRGKEGQVKSLMKLQASRQSPDDEEEEDIRHAHVAHDEEQDADAEDPGTLTDTDEEDEDIDARFTDVETDLETLIWETHEIAKYTTLCHTGFTKITKVCRIGMTR